MRNYPKNRTYVIIPIEKTLSCVGSVLEVCRKSLDRKFMVWDYPEKSEVLDKLKKDDKIKLLSHADVLELMATDEWQKKELDFFSSPK